MTAVSRQQKAASYLGYVSSTLRLTCILVTLLVVVFIYLPIAEASEPLGNPYKILGVNRHATLPDIRKAYKNLVKEW